MSGPETVMGVGYSTIGGGQGNTVDGANDPTEYATIAGGVGNFIGRSTSAASIGGGRNNTVVRETAYSTIGGGLGNYANAGRATIAGGADNTVDYEFGPFGGSGAIGGGQGNRVSGMGVVPGGLTNVAGPLALAAGRGANASQGCFVWADSQDAGFSSTTTDEASFRCRGGVRFTSGSAGGNQTVSWTPGAGSWSFSSDRALKDRLEPVSPEAILDKVSRLPVVEWSYRDYAQRHIGVMAQDFHEQFPLNDNDKMLNDADLHGVTLAAIQGLNQKLGEREAEISTLRKQNQSLEERLNDLEKIVRVLREKP